MNSFYFYVHCYVRMNHNLEKRDEVARSEERVKGSPPLSARKEIIAVSFLQIPCLARQQRLAILLDYFHPIS